MDDFLQTQKKCIIFAKIEKFDGNFFIYFIWYIFAAYNKKKQVNFKLNKVQGDST